MNERMQRPMTSRDPSVRAVAHEDGRHLDGRLEQSVGYAERRDPVDGEPLALRLGQRSAPPGAIIEFADTRFIIPRK